MIGLVLAAALSGLPPSDTVEDFDLRCVRAAMLSMLETQEPAQHSALFNMTTFYIGRLTARADSEDRDWAQVAGDRAYFASSDREAIRSHIRICGAKMRAATHSP